MVIALLAFDLSVMELMEWNKNNEIDYSTQSIGMGLKVFVGCITSMCKVTSTSSLVSGIHIFN
jgi:hypothetical protein